MNSRSKGIRGELEWRDEVARRGYTAKRGQQHAGGGDSPDVIHDVPGVHFEVKRTNALRLYDAVNQARQDGAGLMPVVAHRCDASRKKDDCRGEWLVVLSADDFFKLLEEADRGPRLLQRD